MKVIKYGTYYRKKRQNYWNLDSPIEHKIFEKIITEV